MIPRRMHRLLIAGLPLAFLAMAFYLPVGRLFYDALRVEGRFSLEPVRSILTDPYVLRVIGFTAKQALLSTLLSVAIGLPWAYIFTRYRFPGRRLLRSLTIVPFVLPAITVAVGFILFFGNNGHLNRMLMELFGLPRPPLSVLYSLRGIVLAHAFYNAPLITRLVHAQWETIDPAYEESAQSLGAGRLRRFVGITLPSLMPGLMTGAALAFIFCFLSFPIVLALGGARFSTVEVEIFTRFVVLFQEDSGAVLALVEIILSLLFTFGYLWLEGRFSRPVLSIVRHPTAHLFRRWTVGKVLLWLFISVSGVLFLGPIVSVVVDSFTRVWGGETMVTVHWYRTILSPDYSALIGTSPLGAIGNSLRFALGAMVLAVSVGMPMAYVVARFRFRGRRLFDTLTMASLGVSSVALGAALLSAFLRPPLMLANGVVAIILAHSILAYPFVVRAIVPVLEGLRRGPIEAARTLGASPMRAFLDVELPLVRRAVLVGAVFAFAVSLGEMSATILLAQPEWKTMPLVVNDLRAARSFGGASAMSCLLMVATSCAFLFIDRSGERVLGGGRWRK